MTRQCSATVTGPFALVVAVQREGHEGDSVAAGHTTDSPTTMGRRRANSNVVIAVIAVVGTVRIHSIVHYRVARATAEVDGGGGTPYGGYTTAFLQSVWGAGGDASGS